jgi:ankyrin repeat protein
MHPLLEAIQRGDLEEVARLCAAHPSWLVGEHAFRPLYSAAYRGNAEILECLLRRGADPNVAGHYGHESMHNGLIRPIHAAAGGGHVEAVAHLLEHGADLRGGNRYQTPLLLAAEAGHKPVVKLLVKQGALADVFVASALGKREAVRTLLARDPSRARRKTEFGVTALMIAAAHGFVEIAEALLAAGADPQARDPRRNFVLDYAAGIGHYDPLKKDDAGQAQVAERLLAGGAEVNGRNWRRVSPLHHAARTARARVAQVLLERGAQVDARDITGETPLRRAVMNPAELDVARLLIAHGADVNARDKRGRRILAAARGSGMKSLLKKHGAR